jgi:hypothetical protein
MSGKISTGESFLNFKQAYPQLRLGRSELMLAVTEVLRSDVRIKTQTGDTKSVTVTQNAKFPSQLPPELVFNYVV